MAVDPSGKFIATGSDDKKMRVWSVEEKTVVAELEHGGVVYSVAFDPSGKFIATGSVDKKMRVQQFGPFLALKSLEAGLTSTHLFAHAAAFTLPTAMSGYTLLHCAVLFGSHGLCFGLADQRAHMMSQRSARGDTPMDLAVQLEREAVVRALLDAGSEAPHVDVLALSLGRDGPIGGMLVEELLEEQSVSSGSAYLPAAEPRVAILQFPASASVPVTWLDFLNEFRYTTASRRINSPSVHKSYNKFRIFDSW